MIHPAKYIGVPFTAGLLLVLTNNTLAVERTPAINSRQAEIHHIPSIDMPYDSRQKPVTLPAQRPYPDGPYYYPIEERHYYEPAQVQTGEDEGEYIKDEYNNCYQVKYEQGFRTLVDVRSKLCN